MNLIKKALKKYYQMKRESLETDLTNIRLAKSMASYQNDHATVTLMNDHIQRTNKLLEDVENSLDQLEGFF